MTPDPRLTPARPDLAAAHLKGAVEAERFVEGGRHRVVRAAAPVTREPSPDAPLTTQVLHGETVMVYETTVEGWAWGQIEADGYVGWLPAEALGPASATPTHKVAALRAPVFPGPSIKLPPRELLSFASRVTVVRTEGKFLVTDDGGFLFARHLVPVEAREDDYVEVASRFLGAAYLWGGRSSLGLDCSGLVQVALQATGIACPRDSDMQEKALGTALDFAGDITRLRRGDLVFWPGHVAIIEDGGTLLHATAHFMSVVREPLRSALVRIEATSAPVRSIRRLG
ncbi:C40 family peptidase [Ancylobacter sp. A5.8]|uniref:C40 family peptidase n=1 Tax=Ancylobacter gelatini TaxID=2919920 RepID=UPI001F4E10DE|nr:NlpC/P60 family protein [Ancylobacter gelatini]MCJ8144604.1 C40 family peptidase [Ancylobacter gelatini]